MAYQLITQAVTSDGSGNVAVDTVGVLNGNVKAVRYVHNGTTQMTGTPTLALTGTVTGKLILSATIAAAATDQEWLPQELSAKNTDGTATTQFVDIPIAEQVHLVMANCGAAKKGTIYLIVGD